MQRTKELQQGEVISLEDVEQGGPIITEVPVFGHVEEEEFDTAFWGWHRRLPEELRVLVRGYEEIEYGYGLWERDVNYGADASSFLYAPADFYAPCGYEFPVTMGKTILEDTQGVREFEGVGSVSILGGFIGKSSCQYIYVAKPERFSHEIIFSPGNRLALVNPRDLPRWDALWRKHVGDSG